MDPSEVGLINWGQTERGVLLPIREQQGQGLRMAPPSSSETAGGQPFSVPVHHAHSYLRYVPSGGRASMYGKGSERGEAISKGTFSLAALGHFGVGPEGKVPIRSSTLVCNQ